MLKVSPSFEFFAMHDVGSELINSKYTCMRQITIRELMFASKVVVFEVAAGLLIPSSVTLAKHQILWVSR